MNLFNQPLLQQFAPALERAINAALAMDPGAEKKLQPLNGCVLEIRISNLNQSLFIGAKGNRVLLLSAEHSPTVTMTASLLTLAKLAAKRDSAALIANRDLSFSGDAVRAQQIQRFTDNLDIDWEGLLARFIGDTPAKFLTSGAKQSLTLAKTFGQNFARDLEEFIKYELRLLPSRALADKQFDAIDQLRIASDRLEARVKALTNRIKRG
jgi:ubiquinone biosynthesis accessory factor UbiJ